MDIVAGSALVAAQACGDSDLVLSDLAREAMLVRYQAGVPAIGPAYEATSLYDG